MSKRLQSTATCSKMAAVGATLDKSKVMMLKSKVVAWLSDNTSVLERLWDLMESELIFELLGAGEKHLPKDCTTISKLTASMQKIMINRGLQKPFTKDLLKSMKELDAKIVDKLFTFKFAFPRTYPLMAALSFVDLWRIVDIRDEVLGKRLSSLHVEADGSVDWGRQGIYCFAKLGGDGAFSQVLDPSEFKAASHVLHKPSGKAVSLTQLECPVPSEDYTFLENWDEQAAMISNGKRLKLSLFEEFQQQQSFDYEARFSHKWGDNSWKTLCGWELKKVAAETKKAILEGEAKVQELRDQARAAGTPTPLKRRRLS
eukprot:TRINITY_DN110702_c0_g1_i1.p1 TRINITY_DN110702_c0_g1~~TRINITY_DN110702_c0_g1_i1.p1  ORF type:complete len:336 (+),score=79.72 TRINITY_DN110702_c0_g1_i1:66-1010(+)